jgi:hypothetical protein
MKNKGGSFNILIWAFILGVATIFLAVVLPPFIGSYVATIFPPPVTPLPPALKTVKIDFSDDSLPPTNLDDWLVPNYIQRNADISDNLPKLPTEYKKRKALVVNFNDKDKDKHKFALEKWNRLCESKKLDRIGSSFQINANAVLVTDNKDPQKNVLGNDSLNVKNEAKKGFPEKYGFGLALKYGDTSKIDKSYKLNLFQDPNKTPEMGVLHKFQIRVFPPYVSFMIDGEESIGQSSFHITKTASKFDLLNEIKNICVGFFVEDPELNLAFYDFSVEEIKNDLDDRLQEIIFRKNKQIEEFEKKFDKIIEQKKLVTQGDLSKYVTTLELKSVTSKLEIDPDIAKELKIDDISKEPKIEPKNPVAKRLGALERGVSLIQDEKDNLTGLFWV